MPELGLFADFGQPLFPVILVCQRVGVRAPEFLHHLALRHERTFRLGIFERVLQLAQGQLRAGHHRHRAEPPVERVHRVVERAPAFRVSATPKRRLRVQPREIPERDADLSHRFGLVAHHVPENRFQHRVDDGILKLRFVKTMSAADFGEIVEPHRQ